MDEETRFLFYDQRLPSGLYTLAHLETWYKKQAGEHERQALFMDDEFLLSHSPDLQGGAFPDELEWDGMRLPLEYSFDPTGDRDGVTVIVPAGALQQLHAERLAWLVPGLLREKLEALIRGLPKARRRHFVPVPDYVAALQESLSPDQPLLPAMTRELQRMTGVRVEQEEWREDQLPGHLRMNVRVTDGQGKVLAEDRDLARLQQRFEALAGEREASPAREEVVSGRTWVFGTLPACQESEQGGVVFRRYPALRDRGEDVALEHHADADDAHWWHGIGCARLMLLALNEQVRGLKRFAGQQPGFQKLKAEKSAMARGALDQALLRATVSHFHLHDQPLRDEAAFRERLDQGRGEFVPAVEQALRTWGELFAAYRRVMQRLEKNFPLAWAHAHRDLKQQLADLFSDDFLLTVPKEWLDQYPRYLAAVEQRLEKLGGQIGRDRAVVAELEEFRERYHRRAKDTPPWRQSEALRLYRWMMEEYRVSLFAQPLGTRVPVSAKRLNRQWEAC